MRRKRKLAIAVVVLVGLGLAAGTFWACSSVSAPHRESTPRTADTIPIRPDPLWRGLSQPSSKELRAAAKVAIAFVEASVTGCHGRQAFMDQVRPYVTDHFLQATATRGVACVQGSHVEIRDGITSSGLLEELDEKPLKLSVDVLIERIANQPQPIPVQAEYVYDIFLVHEKDGWRVNDFFLAGEGLVRF